MGLSYLPQLAVGLVRLGDVLLVIVLVGWMVFGVGVAWKGARVRRRWLDALERSRQSGCCVMCGQHFDGDLSDEAWEWWSGAR